MRKNPFPRVLVTVVVVALAVSAGWLIWQNYFLTPWTRDGRVRANIVQIQPGEECPAGTTEVRPRQCQAPDFPPPTIVDYRPHSTLKVAEHLVPKAKFPVIDYHGHPPAEMLEIRSVRPSAFRISSRLRSPGSEVASNLRPFSRKRSPRMSSRPRVIAAPMPRIICGLR